MNLSFQKTLLELDSIEPGLRFDRLNLISEIETSESLYYDAHLVLVCLYTIDKVIRLATQNNYLFYILGDDSVYSLLEKCGYQNMSGEHGRKVIIQLGIAQLVYRFNTAKKFSILETNTKQLRLNSWGHSYIVERSILSEMREYVALITEQFNEYYTCNAQLYKDLTNLLLSDITPETAEIIKDINTNLQIKLLS